MLEIKSELRALADDIEAQVKTPAQLRAKVIEIIQMMDDFDEHYVPPSTERDFIHG